MKRLVIFGGEDIISDSAHPVPTQQRFRQAQLPAPPEPSPFLDAQLTPLPCPCSSPGSPGPSLPRTQRAVSGTADLGVPAKCTSVLCVALKTLQNLVSPLPKPSQTHARAHAHTRTHMFVHGHALPSLPPLQALPPAPNRPRVSCRARLSGCIPPASNAPARLPPAAALHRGSEARVRKALSASRLAAASPEPLDKICRTISGHARFALSKFKFQQTNTSYKRMIRLDE